jgi:pimeloyl-ACP methyl ester carboxylesterase
MDLSYNCCWLARNVGVTWSLGFAVTATESSHFGHIATNMKIPLPVSMLTVNFSVIWVMMCPVWNPWLIDGMLFHPDKEIDTKSLSSIAGVTGREITFGDGVTGWLYQIPKSKFVILFSHGNACNLSRRVDKIARLLDCGQSVFIWDYPGFGHSKGLASLKSIGNCAASAYDCVRAMGYAPDQIVLYGESIGSGINAEILNRQRKAKALIIDSGFTSLEEVGKEKCPIFRLYPSCLLPTPSMKVRDSMNGLPCLLIHGEQDVTIPCHHAWELQKADSHSTLVLLPHSPHSGVSSEDTSTVQAALRKFFVAL